MTVKACGWCDGDYDYCGTLAMGDVGDANMIWSLQCAVEHVMIVMVLVVVPMRLIMAMMAVAMLMMVMASVVATMIMVMHMCTPKMLSVKVMPAMVPSHSALTGVGSGRVLRPLAATLGHMVQGHLHVRHVTSGGR